MSTLGPIFRRSGGGGEPPGLGSRLAVLAAAAVAIIGILVLRLWFLQVVSNGDYARQANSNRFRTIVDEPPRGAIEDRRGRPLVTNRQVQNVVARPQELGWQQGAEGKLGHAGPEGVALLRRLAPIVHRGPDALMLDFRSKAQATPLNDVVVARDVKPDVIAYLAERERSFRGIGVQAAYLRQYPRRELASQILGVVNSISKEQVRDYRRRGYFGNEDVGQSGVERTFEDYLRGRVGERQVEVDSFGEVVGSGIVSAKPAVQGKTVQLTIDAEVNKVLQDQIALQVARSGFSNAGAGVALDVNTGEVLAMASIPSFDANDLVGGGPKADRINRDRRHPQQNLAISGLYPPGSTFKPITATGMIETGYVTGDEVLPCPSFLELYEKKWPNFKNEFFDPLALPRALEVSCDTYFYGLAARVFEKTRKLEETPMQDWARAFGFGQRPGLDIGGDSAGVLPDFRYKQETFANSPDPGDRSWRPGDSINLSVGQGLLQATPLQMAVAYAAIANGGRVVKPRLIRKVIAPDRSLVVDFSSQVDARPVATPTAQLDPQTLDPIRRGLFLVANGEEGTAYNVMHRLPDRAKVAGKTGTAENYRLERQRIVTTVNGKRVVTFKDILVPNQDHSWFVGYAPADKPKIVVAVVIANGGTGASAAAPVVCHTVVAYVNERSKEKIDATKACGNGTDTVD